MKSKAPLALMEQMVMLLVFASLQSLTVPMPPRAFPLRSIIPRIGGFPIPGSMRIASGRRKWTVVFPAWDRPG